MKRAFVVFAVLAASSSLSIADARPSVTVVGDAPFSDRELGDALDLRVVGDIPVVITRAADGRLIVEVGDRQQIIDPPAGDPHASARVVAMVVVALVEDPAREPGVIDPPGRPRPGSLATAEPAAGEHRLPTPAPQPAPGGLRTVRLTPSLVHNDGGYNSPFLTASLAYHIGPHIRVVGSVGIGRGSDHVGSEIGVPIKAGVEGLAGGLGIEVGGYATPIQSDCMGRTGTAGVYGAVHLYVPVTPRGRLVIEGGGEFALAEPRIGFTTQNFCYGVLSGTSYAGSAGLGGEWSF